MYMLNVTLGQRAVFNLHMILSDTVKMKEYQKVSVICFDCHLTFSSQLMVKLLVILKSERLMTHRSVLQLSVSLSGRQALFFT